MYLEKTCVISSHWYVILHSRRWTSENHNPPFTNHFLGIYHGLSIVFSFATYWRVLLAMKSINTCIISYLYHLARWTPRIYIYILYIYTYILLYIYILYILYYIYTYYIYIYLFIIYIYIYYIYIYILYIYIHLFIIYIYIHVIYYVFSKNKNISCHLLLVVVGSHPPGLGWSQRKSVTWPAQKRTLGGLKLLRSILPPGGNGPNCCVQWGEKKRRPARKKPPRRANGYWVRQEKSGWNGSRWLTYNPAVHSDALCMEYTLPENQHNSGKSGCF